MRRAPNSHDSRYGHCLSRVLILLSVALVFGIHRDSIAPFSGGATDAGHAQRASSAAFAIGADGSFTSTTSSISHAHQLMTGSDGPNVSLNGCNISTPTPTVTSTVPATTTLTPTDSATATASPTAPTTSTNVAFGVVFHPMWQSLADTYTDLSRVEAAGITMVRLDVDWDKLEPAPNTWSPTQLGKLDSIISAMDARGISGIFILLYTPAWARNNAGTNLTPPTNPDDFGVAAGYLAARYANHPNMAWEIWNEPNDLHFWNTGHCTDPTFYTLMLQSAYTHIKAVAPSATVLGGSLVFNDQAYLDRMYAAGAQGYFDALAVHPYCVCAPSSTLFPHYSFPLTVTGMEADMASHGEPNKPIWITEVGWSTNWISDTVRGAFMQQAVSMLRAWPFVKAYCANTLKQTNDPSFGLIASDGTPTQSWTTYSIIAQSASSTPTPTATATSSAIPTATNTPPLPATSSPAPSATSAPIPTAANTPTPTMTNSPIPIATNSPIPIATNSPIAIATSSPIAIATSSPIAIATSSPSPLPTATSNLTPTLTGGSAAVRPYSTLVVTGANFLAGEPIAIHWDALPATLVSSTAAITGSFVATMTVPEAISGLHTLTAIGQTSAFSATAPVRIMPDLIFSPALGHAGSVTHIVGFGFGAKEQVKLHWYQPLTLMGATQTNALGSFSGATAITMTVPLSATLGVGLVFGTGQTTFSIGFGFFDVM